MLSFFHKKEKHIMKIRQLIPIPSDYAVLATRKSDFEELCRDRQGDGHNFFWAVLDRNYEDTIELVDVDVDGKQEICECRLVVRKQPCPYCTHMMEPEYDNASKYTLYQKCPKCHTIVPAPGRKEE
jgi:hypothetical protein